MPLFGQLPGQGTTYTGNPLFNLLRNLWHPNAASSPNQPWSEALPGLLDNTALTKAEKFRVIADPLMRLSTMSGIPALTAVGAAGLLGTSAYASIKKRKALDQILKQNTDLFDTPEKIQAAHILINQGVPSKSIAQAFKQTPEDLLRKAQARQGLEDLTEEKRRKSLFGQTRPTLTGMESGPFGLPIPSTGSKPALENFPDLENILKQATPDDLLSRGLPKEIAFLPPNERLSAIRQRAKTELTAQQEMQSLIKRQQDEQRNIIANKNYWARVGIMADEQGNALLGPSGNPLLTQPMQQSYRKMNNAQLALLGKAINPITGQMEETDPAKSRRIHLELESQKIALLENGKNVAIMNDTGDVSIVDLRHPGIKAVLQGIGKTVPTRQGKVISVPGSPVLQQNPTTGTWETVPDPRTGEPIMKPLPSSSTGSTTITEKEDIPGTEKYLGPFQIAPPKQRTKSQRTIERPNIPGINLSQPSPLKLSGKNMTFYRSIINMNGQQATNELKKGIKEGRITRAEAEQIKQAYNESKQFGTGR